MKIRSKLLFTAAAALLSMGAVAAPAHASVAAVAPAPSASGGVITICPGIRLNLDDRAGRPLSIAEQQSLIYTLTTYRCNLPDQSSSVIPAQPGTRSRMVSPDAAIGGGGEVLMHINISKGNLGLNATASSMPYGTERVLSCTYSISGAAYESCGKAQGPGTSLSTRNNEFHPAAGKSVDGIAEVAVGNVSYVDDNYGITK